MKIVSGDVARFLLPPPYLVSNGIGMLEFIAGVGGLIGLAVCLLVLHGHFDD